MKANDSLECRNCYSTDSMDITRESPRAADAHQRFLFTGEKILHRLRTSCHAFRTRRSRMRRSSCQSAPVRIITTIRPARRVGVLSQKDFSYEERDVCFGSLADVPTKRIWPFSGLTGVKHENVNAARREYL